MPKETVLNEKRKIKEQELKSIISLEKGRGDRFAIRMSELFGSLRFLLTCLVVLAIYFSWNLDLIPGVGSFDAPPFFVLDTALSIFAIILSISVLISQNRQRKLEKIREQVEFEVNVRAEGEITKILGMLHAIQRKMGINEPDKELEQMKESLDLDKLHQEVKNAED
jgi:uncharacterized membrane protein